MKLITTENGAHTNRQLLEAEVGVKCAVIAPKTEGVTASPQGRKC